MKNIRTIAVPGDDVYTFTTAWEYDTWNRLTKMTYPDGEELTYTYNTGGLLRSMSGKRLGHRYNYLTQLGYDKFENRVYLSYGNGTETTYDYEQDRRRLSHITATTSNGRKMMDNTYSYDKVNNILSLVNEAPQVTPNRKGGPFEYTYQYDDLYRLTHAEGDWKGATHEHRYELDMQYSPTGRILHKTQTHDRMSYDEPGTWVPQHKTTYDWEYKYEGPQPHAATHIGENTYTYDANGNQLDKRDKNNQRRQILWDEENRMRAIADNGTTHHYIYDASGERVIKSTGDGQAIYVNGFPMGGSGTVGNYTMYVNPFMVVSNSKYTKHFYIEGQRIVSKLGEMGVEQELLKPKSHAGDSTKNPVQWDTKKDLTKDIIIANFEALGLNGAVFTAGKSGKMPYGQIKKYFRGNDVVINPGTPTSLTSPKTEDLQFYYHPDHLGSSNYITDASGEVYQHQEYFPFGETFVEERNDAEYTTYLFNGKELDEETGLYYYGARYYDPRTSLWYGVDPMAEKFNWVTPYNYAENKPISNVDLWGLQAVNYLVKNQYKSATSVTNVLDNVNSFLYNSFVANTYNASAAVINYSAKIGETSWNQGLGSGAMQVMDDIGQAGDNFIKNVKAAATTPIKGKDVAEAFTNLENYESAVYLPFAAKGIANSLSKSVSKTLPQAANSVLKYEQSSLQHMFSRHAKDFGITGNWSKTAATEFGEILKSHIQGVKPIQGTYRGTQNVLHYFNPKSGLNVMTDLQGNLIGGWKLSADQIKYLQTTGAIK